MTIEVITYNDKYLLVPGTDQPQRDAEGTPIPDPKYGTTKTIVHPDPPTAPLLLSATAFNEYAWSQLGGGVVGMARFQQIIDDAIDAKGAAKAVATQYGKSVIFDHTKVSAFVDILKGLGHMTDAEAKAIASNWPKG